MHAQTDMSILPVGVDIAKLPAVQSDDHRLFPEVGGESSDSIPSSCSLVVGLGLVGGRPMMAPPTKSTLKSRV